MSAAPIAAAGGPVGLRMPAEWEPHAATWLAWPHKRESWPGNFGPIPGVWVELVRVLAAYEPVHILVADHAMAATVRRALAAVGVSARHVAVFWIPTDDAWIRDHGPTFVTRGAGTQAQVAAVDWRFNAWGGKYPPWDHDDAVPRRVAAALGIERYAADLVLEGGSIDVNGRGTVLTTEACLLNPNRNPHLGRPQIEGYLRKYLGVRHILWLGNGIAGDDTDGHVDDLARFVDAHTVVTVREPDPADENYEPLRANYERLRAMTDQDGRPLRVATLPMPRPVFYEGQRLPASYANFYIANGIVVVPVFADPADAEALRTLQALFPGRRVVGLPARDLVLGLGAFHCITQQQPALPVG